jgi:hypothetical protein
MAEGRLEQVERRSLWQGFGDGLSSAVEMAVAPIAFALLGRYLDGHLGTGSVLTVTLLLAGVVGCMLRAWYHYSARLEALEEGKPWQR